MRADRARLFVMATLGETGVYYGSMPDAKDGSLDNIIAVYGEGADPNPHNGVKHARFQAIVRNAEYLTGEAKARTIFDAVNGLYGLKAYDGIYLAANMDGTTDPVTFAPDNGAGTSKASALAVNDYFMIDSEILRVTTVNGANVTASRAKLGTAKAAHLDNAEALNLTKVPVPGELCGTCVPEGDVLELGKDNKDRWEFAVNWTVVVK